MNERQIGVIQVIASGACFGFLGYLGKQAYSAGLKPGELLALRFVFAAILSYLWLALNGRKLRRLRPKEWALCAGLGILGYALFSLCFFSALEGLSASLTVLLLYTFPALVALGGWLLFGERITRSQLPALPLAGLGMLGLVWGDLSYERAGFLLFGLGSAVLYAIYILVSSHALKTVDPRISTPAIQLFAGLALSTVFLRDVERSWALVQASFGTLILVAFVCTVLAMSLFLAGLQKLKSWEVSVLSTTEPLVGVLAATLLLNERLSGIQIAGGCAVLGALVWVSLGQRRSLS